MIYIVFLLLIASLIFIYRLLNRIKEMELTASSSLRDMELEATNKLRDIETNSANQIKDLEVAAANRVREVEVALNNRIKELEIMALKKQEENRVATVISNKKSVEISRRVIKGKISEEMAPLLPGFPYIASDMKFMGQPIDYVCFEGYTEVRDGVGQEIELVFMDIKTGKAGLSKPQKSIQAAVVNRRVRGETIRINDGEITIEPWIL